MSGRFVLTIFKGKGDAMSCRAYRGMKLLEHAMKVVGKVLEIRLRHMVKLDEMQLGERFLIFEG